MSRPSVSDPGWATEYLQERVNGNSSKRKVVEVIPVQGNYSPGVSGHLIIAALFINVLINAISLGNCLARGTKCTS